jgi:hypothetical protein
MPKRDNLKLVLFTLITFLLLFTKNARAQQWKLFRYEVSGGLSTCNYFGDIGGSTSSENLYGLKDIELFNSRPSLYFAARYYLTERFALKPSLYFGFAHGTDENSFYKDRGYGFNTSFLLPKVNLEYSLFKVNDLFGKRKMKFLNYTKPLNKTFVVYLCAGGGYNFYNVILNDKLNNYKIVSASRSNSKYVASDGQSSAFTYNAGIGLKYFFVSFLAFNASLEYHSVLADNFDGYSTKSKTNDIFYITSFGLSYRLPTNEWGQIDWFVLKRKWNDLKKDKNKTSKAE